MRIITKKIKVISMTMEEHQAFMDTVQRAAEGRTVNYAESRLEDGSYLGVSIESEEETRLRKKTMQEFADQRAQKYDKNDRAISERNYRD